MLKKGTKADRIGLLEHYSAVNAKKPTKAEDRFLLLLYQVRKYLRFKDIDLGEIRPQEIVFSNTALTGYITDYYIPRLNLVIEIDGGYHNNRKAYDKKRDKYIEKKLFGKYQYNGICKVIRYKNEQVFTTEFRDKLRIDILDYIKVKFPKGSPDLHFRPLPKGTIKEHRYTSYMKERHLMR
jgi:very-short-patch-repair endonuclease